MTLQSIQSLLIRHSSLVFWEVRVPEGGKGLKQVILARRQIMKELYINNQKVIKNDAINIF